MLELFAQVKKTPPPPNAADAGAAAAGFGIFMIILFVIYGLLFISMIIQIVFVIMTWIAQSKSLTLMSRKYRQMEPGQVWLCLIPVFGTVWFILTIIRVGDGLVKMYKSVGAKPNPPDGAKSFGIIAFCVSMFLGCIPFLSPVMFYMYWKKLTQLNVSLEKAIKRARDAEDEDEDEDEDE